MHTSLAHLAAWRNASADLGFVFTSPFTLDHDGRAFFFFGHLPQFGAKEGMLVLTEYNPMACETATTCGFGYSCISESDDPYDRQDFIELLKDWGWSASEETPPAWYSGTRLST